MLEQFLNHLGEKNLCGKSDRILVAVSGGVDSMVLLHLFVRAGIRVGVAHANFGLRAEAVEEEGHVKQVCRLFDIPFYVRHFETQAFAARHKLSIQVAARNLRYDFFREVAESEGYNWVATAHHANDNLETVLLNLVRGTGMDGLTGIPVKQGRVIRPLLFATRAEILTWARGNGVSWKEDASNSADYYHRNMLRNQVIPRLYELNPSLANSFAGTLERLKGTRDLASQTIRAFKKASVRETNDNVVIDRASLAITEYPAVLLWEVIKGWGFCFDQCVDVVKASHPGKQFLSATHQLTVDRDTLIICPVREVVLSEVMIEESDTIVDGPWSTLHLKSASAQEFVLDKDNGVANIDFDKLEFPLIWRTWRAGDVFVPLGMKQRKKVSDFLIDLKISRPRKERITVLESGGTIAWIVGHRIADPFKIKSTTSRILIIREVPAANDFV